MSIDFAFGIRSTDPAIRGIWYELYTRLNETEKHFFNNHLPPMLMSVGINHVSAETIPHIVARLALMDALQGGRTWAAGLEVLHVLTEHGEEAAMKFQAAQAEADKLVEASLPEGFEPNASKALERLIGFVSNIGTETSQEFLSSLTKLRFHPFPELTATDAMREDKNYRAFAKDVASEAIPHPALSEEVATA
jgi:hypothetical protein